MDRRAFVPAALRPAFAGPGAEIIQPVVTALVPDRDLAAGQPHMRKIVARIHPRLVTAVESGHERVEDGKRLGQRIAHPACLRANAVQAVRSAIARRATMPRPRSSPRT